MKVSLRKSIVRSQFVKKWHAPAGNRDYCGLLMKLLLPFSFFLLTLPSCDSAKADHHAEAESTQKVSTAVIQILPTSPVLADPALRTPNFIENEISSLSMGAVLNQALRDNQWEERKVELKDLRSALQVERLEGTDLARLTATGSEKLSGEEIIDGVIRSYLDIRRTNEMGMSQRLLKALDDELIAQSDLVQDYRKEVMILIQQYGIPYFENQPNFLGQAETVSHAKVHDKFQELRLEETLLKAHLSGLDEASKELAPLSEELKTVSRQVKAVQELVAQLEDQRIDLSLKQNAYQRAKDNYERALVLLKGMKLKQQEARVALKMPITPLIIREQPE